MSEMGPVVVRPGGEVKTLRLAEVIKLKAYLGDLVPETPEEVDKILTDVNIPVPSVYKERREYHQKEVYRRKNRICDLAKQQVLDTFGYHRSFTAKHPEFMAICEEYNYSPWSLAGTLVRYGFVECIGQQEHRVKSRDLSYIKIYRVVKPQT